MPDKKVSQHSYHRWSNPLYYKYQHMNSHETLSSWFGQSLHRPSSGWKQSMGNLSQRKFSKNSNFS